MVERPPADPRKVVRGPFRILDTGAKWTDPPKCFGSKSTTHRWFQKRVKHGVFEAITRDARRCPVETADVQRRAPDGHTTGGNGTPAIQFTIDWRWPGRGG
ncbi:MAG: transposase [Planctomycetes bacterium]|nr:transposase [Planctomycetota bacterium]